ncbi:MAG: hypothetical protein ACRD6X_17585 [Pyrinomonadaceae bacterium]
MRSSKLLILLFVYVASVAAQTKINYGYEYTCGKERIVAFYCRNDSGQPVPESDNYCSVEYPDRPRSIDEGIIRIETETAAEFRKSQKAAPKPKM